MWVSGWREGPMSEMSTINISDMVCILTTDNQMLKDQIVTLQKQLDEAMDIMDNLLLTGEPVSECEYVWCLTVDRANDLLDQGVVAQALTLLEGGRDE